MGMVTVDILRSDLNQSLKSKDEPKVSTLRLLLSALNYKKIEVQRELTDQDILSVIQKEVKKEADRKLYITLAGDLLECLKRAITIKVEKSIQNSLSDFEEGKKELAKLNTKEKAEVLASLEILENQIKRLNRYVKLLSQINLP